MKTAMELTGNKGYGYVFETAGQVPTMHMALSWLQIRLMYALSVLLM